MSDTEAPSEATADTESEFAPITSQEDLDKIISQRLSRATAKYADYHDLKAKAAKFDQVEEAKKTEVQREREAREAAERERDELRSVQERNLLLDKVSSDTGVPKRLLVGSTEEELRASADELLKWQGESGKPRPPKPNPAQGKDSETPSGDWLRESLSVR
ncbi:hypothetical protein ABQE69_09060 [Mycolicibacillus trivialis]